MNSKSPRVQVRSQTRAAPKNGGNGNSTPNGFGIDLAQPPIPDKRIVEQPRRSWPEGGRAPQSDRLPSGPGTDGEPLLVRVGEVLARNEPPEPAPLPPPGRTMYNIPQRPQPAQQTPGWGFSRP
jgi:hypothetical protein